MAEAVITCPECDKRFKGKAELEGKKVRCPHCSEPFRVSEDLMAFPKGNGKKAESSIAPSKPKVKSAAPKVEAPPPPPPPAPEKKEEDDDDLDDGKNPYGVKTDILAARCPNCAKELVDEKSVVCVYCGYNSLTREIGTTEKTYELTFGEHLVHLLAPMGALFFCVLIILLQLYICVVVPVQIQFGSWMSFLDSEPVRLGSTILFLKLFIFPAAFFGVFKLINEPKPKERVKE